MTDPVPATSSIEAAMASLLADYGDFLDDAQQQDVRRRVDGLNHAADAMRRIPLANGEAPAWPVPRLGRGDR